MKLVKKNNEEVYQVADNSYFEQYTNTISEPDDNGTVFDFLQENVKGTDIEDDYNAWLKEYANSYYFSVVASKQDDYYAVASDEVHGVVFAVEVENPNEDEGATFEDVESTIHYSDTTAFVYNDRTQTMCSVSEITEDSLRPFEKASGKI